MLLPLDKDLVGEVHAYLRGQGLDLRLSTAVTGFRRRGGKVETLIGEEAPVAADLVILAIGVAPESDLARRAGLTLGQKGAIVVDDHMRTSHPDIYAVGDAVELTHAVTGHQKVWGVARDK